MADKQRGRVYAAENQVTRLVDLAAAGDGSVELHRSRITLPVERRFGNYESLQKYVDWVILEGEFDPERVTVVAKEGIEKAFYHYGPCGGQIHIPQAKWHRNDWAMREMVVLHELAHHLNRREFEAHGPEFCAALLALLEWAVGPEYAFLLRVAFADFGCKVYVAA